jgi:nucleotide-binding universal stress UspA family protein
MYKCILAAVDGSDTSNRALEEAIKLAKDQQPTLRLIHVVDDAAAYLMMETPDQVPYLIAEYQKALREGGQQLLSTCAARVRAAGLEPETKMRTIETLDQHVYDAVAEEAEQWPVDLIVIGTHGRRGFRRLMLGSVAEGALQLCQCCLFVMHNHLNEAQDAGRRSQIGLRQSRSFRSGNRKWKG